MSRIHCAIFAVAIFFLSFTANIASNYAVALDISDTKPPKIVSITNVPLNGVTGWARYQVVVEDDKNSVSRSWGNSPVTNFNDPRITISSEIQQELSVAPTCRPWPFYGNRPILETREDSSQSSSDGRRKVFVITLRTILPLMSQNSTGQEPVSSDCFKLLNKGDWFLEYSLGTHFKDAAGNYNDQDLRSSDASVQSLIRTKVKLAPESIYCLPFVREISSTNPSDLYQLDFPWNELIALKTNLLALNDNQDPKLKQILEYVTPLSGISEIRRSIQLSNSLAKGDQLNAWNVFCDKHREEISWLKFQQVQIPSDISYVQNFKAAVEQKAKQEAEAKAASELKAKQEAEAKAAAELKAKQEAEVKAAAELKAKQDAEAKAAAELKAKQEAEAKAAAELKAKQEAEAKAIADKAAAELKAKQDAEAKAIADKAAAEANRREQIISSTPFRAGSVPFSSTGLPTKVASSSNLPVFAYNSTNEVCVYENGVIRTKTPGRCVIAFSQEGNSEFKPASNLVLDFVLVSTTKKTTITCIKGKLTKKVTAMKPKCPTGFKLRK